MEHRSKLSSSEQASRRLRVVAGHLENAETKISGQRVADGHLGEIEQILTQNKDFIDASIAEWLPRFFDTKTLTRLCGPARYAYDEASATKSVADPMWDILDRGGKRWRPTLLLLIAEALGKPVSAVKDLIVLCEVVHNGTLLIDDIEDRSEVRRGKPCIHLLYGVDVAVNAGNGMYYLPTVVLREMRGKVPDATLVQAYELYNQEMINLHFGQGFDIWWHQGKPGERMPTEAEYLQMCAFKTGTLARLSAKLAALFSNGSQKQIDAIGRFAEAIGVGFQIQDDILNIAPSKVAESKGYRGEDVTEGKRTLMVIHAVTHAPKKDADRLIEILNAHPTDQKVINEAIAIMERSKSVQYASQRAAEIVRAAWSDVDATLPAGEGKRKLKAFADFLVERSI